MAYCPECNITLQGNPERCYVCGHQLTSEEKADWVVLGLVAGKPFADLAKETLESLKIPAVVISKSGFFGNVGLPLNPIYESKPSEFEISVPSSYEDEATEALEATLGDRWQRKDKE